VKKELFFTVSTKIFVEVLGTCLDDLIEKLLGIASIFILLKGTFLSNSVG
jgi:hypothetical protein